LCGLRDPKERLLKVSAFGEFTKEYLSCLSGFGFGCVAK
jgi:hypothetical protein